MKRYLRGWSTTSILALVVIVAIATAGVTALLVNVFERKTEAKQTFVRLAEVTEDTTDPAEWGINFPQQYDSYLRTAEATRTRFGGHGGSEALPEQKIERDPWLQRMFRGYAFSIDYRRPVPACTATHRSCRCTVNLATATRWPVSRRATSFPTRT
jgi:nitrite reductase (cytochrome c-552)